MLQSAYSATMESSPSEESRFRTPRGSNPVGPATNSYLEVGSIFIWATSPFQFIMGRRPKDLSRLDGDSVKPFLEAIKSPATREVYQRRLATFLERIDMNADGFVSKSRTNPSWAQELILKFLMGEKDRASRKEIESSTVRNVLKPVRVLLDMNDVSGVNWKKISRMMPTARRYALDRAPTIEELRLLTSNADTRFQAILLSMLSSGIRVGAWEYLNWGNVEPIKHDGKIIAAKLIIYQREPEEYITFITPEAYGKLEQYIRLRSEHGEKISKHSPLIRDRWQASGRASYQGEILRPKRLQATGIKRLFEDALWKFGMRKEKKRRHEFSIHSLRKFFKTRAEQVMRQINVETLMGHSTGISDSYYRPTEKELLEDYLKAVPLLSISESEELKRVVQVEEQRNSEKIRRLEALVEELVAAKAQQALVLDRNRTSGT
jgi:hypothetical protein